MCGDIKQYVHMMHDADNRREGHDDYLRKVDGMSSRIIRFVLVEALKEEKFPKQQQEEEPPRASPVQVDMKEARKLVLESGPRATFAKQWGVMRR